MTHPTELTTPREVLAALRKPGKAFTNVLSMHGVMVEVVKADVIIELERMTPDSALATSVLLWVDGSLSL
jgi:hypothetical protein